VYEPKPSDLNITRVAAMNDALYSMEAHAKEDPSASPNFLDTHITAVPISDTAISRIAPRLKAENRFPLKVAPQFSACKLTLVSWAVHTALVK